MHQLEPSQRYKAKLIILLSGHGYPPVVRDKVNKEKFEQAGNFKKNTKTQRTAVAVQLLTLRTSDIPGRNYQFQTARCQQG